MSFTLEPGTVTGFLGPNGAGKTTTLRMITGLVPPTAGEAKRLRTPVGPTCPTRPPWPARCSTPARCTLAGPAGPTCAILASTIGVPTRRVDELLDLVGLGNAGRRRIGGYSLGMRQRLGIAAGPLADPPVLILDEPANGLDPEGIRWMRELLRERADRGGTVLLSSHLLGEVLEHTVDRLVVIGAGRVVADGPIGVLLAGDGVRVRAVDTGALADSLRAAGLTVSAEGPALTVAGASADQVGRIAAAGGHVLTDLRPADRGLEDLFFQLTA